MVSPGKDAASKLVDYYNNNINFFKNHAITIVLAFICLFIIINKIFGTLVFKLPYVGVIIGLGDILPALFLTIYFALKKYEHNCNECITECGCEKCSK